MIETFQKHDNLFKNVKPNAIGNIVIFSKDENWQIQQDYSGVSLEENKIWSQLYSKVIPVAKTAVPIEPIPAVAIARPTIPLKVKPVKRLKAVSKGRALELLALLAALEAIKNKISSPIKATRKRG